MNENFQIYPRGFLGASIETSVPMRRSKLQELYERLQYNGNIFTPVGVEIPFNSTIEGNYNLYVTRSYKVMSFDFKEEILRSALCAFGTSNFSLWVSIQRHSPMFTSTHRAFLKDTVRYLKTGERELSLENWDALLNAKASIECKESIQDILSEVRQMFGNGFAATSVRDIVARWCQQYNGMNDLIVTLHILFGN